MNSLTYDAVDMGDYNLVVNSAGASPYGQIVSRIQLQDKGYPFRPQREPRIITIQFTVTGTSRSNLDSNLDNIKRNLTQLVPAQLIFDALSTRYYMAILERFEGNYIQPAVFRGTMRFICPDPVAYSTTETTVTQNVDANPKTLYIPESSASVVGGSAFLLPVWTLTAGETLTTVTVKLNNETTIEELQWIGTLTSGQELIINSSTWLVTKEGVADMADVSGKFPRLEPYIRNQIKVTAFGTAGTLNVTYRDGYL